MGKKGDMIKEKDFGGLHMIEGTKKPKKLIPFCILKILQEESDADHRLSQQDIIKHLKRKFDMDVDRKTVKTNLMYLKEADFKIDYNEVPRPITKDGKNEESYILSDFCLLREFEDSELRLLIDSLLFSKHLPYSQCEALVKKIKGLSNKYFKARTQYISTMPQDRTDNQQLFYTIDIIDEAISKDKKVQFEYLEYDTDLKQKSKKTPTGENKIYVVNPYQMAAKEGKYYLICNYDKYDDISNYRMDRINNIKILDEKRKPYEKLNWADGKRLDLHTYMREHVYMYSSGSTRATFRIEKAMISDVVDMFGNDVKFTDSTDTHVCVKVKANEMSIWQFAKNFAPYVVILEPQRLRDKVIEALKEGLAGYEES